MEQIAIYLLMTNSHLFICKFKAKDSEITPYPLCLKHFKGLVSR